MAQHKHVQSLRVADSSLSSELPSNRVPPSIIGSERCQLWQNYGSWNSSLWNLTATLRYWNTCSRPAPCPTALRWRWRAVDERHASRARQPDALWEASQTLTLGLLRGLVDRPEEAPLIDLDLHPHTRKHKNTAGFNSRVKVTHSQKSASQIKSVNKNPQPRHKSGSFHPLNSHCPPCGSLVSLEVAKNWWMWVCPWLPFKKSCGFFFYT